MAENLVARGVEVSGEGTPTALDDVTTNHLCTTTTTTYESSDDVFVWFRGVVRLGDDAAEHTVGDDPPCAAHTPVLTTASPSVYANGIKIGCEGHVYEGENISDVKQTNVFAESS